jgi:hypothetical protein
MIEILYEKPSHVHATSGMPSLGCTFDKLSSAKVL